ncbi:hypothetical protein [Nocardia cerradoensis]|uniref:Uncharacterized protein n=1 Tax=Nocardia cerradoensis TaxID=85688 RepID=A0A231GT71_9NOCA|nr:hypothetical protein [Nocardia cerradoensis]NKY47976.1 hypothetical protein [Nocardia cerradoensis]OXR39823.1 hypothetical protein B7C42_08111 [Nocardia cerradoensis]
MYSRITNPDTGVTITRRSERRLTETVAIEACDTVDFTVAELRDLATATQHLPDTTPVLLIETDGGDRSIHGLSVYYTRDLDAVDPDADRLNMIETLARQIVTDHLAVRFEESAAWTRDGMSDIPQADADAIVARANTFMAAVADAFRKSGADQ